MTRESDSSNKENENASMAEQAKTFVLQSSTAALSTFLHSKSQSALPGYPYGSVVPYDVDKEGRIIIFISRLAEHFKNLTEDPRASLLIIDNFGTADPQRFARASVVGRFEKIGDEEISSVQDSFWNRFANSPERQIAYDFVFFRHNPERIRWIAGFGDIRWIKPDNYFSAPFDEIAYRGHEILTHMNFDHLDAIQDLYCHFANSPAQKFPAQMVEVSKSGFSLQVTNGELLKRIHIPFEETPLNLDQVRQQIIKLLKAARESVKS